MTVETIVSEPDPEGKLQQFYYISGGKSVGIYVDLHERTAYATVYNNPFPKREGDTTRAFQAASQDLHKLATKIGPITLGFSTENPKLRKWALDDSRGRGIFNWFKVNDINVLDIAIKFSAWTIIE